jgi:anti-sigma B factor antagonist
MMRLADMHVESHDGVVVARVDGEIDLSNAGAIRASVLQQMRNDEVGLALDLTGVRYLDSAGIQIVYELRRLLETRGQQLVLVVPGESLIKRTLDLVGASSTMAIVATLDAALATLDSGASRG